MELQTINIGNPTEINENTNSIMVVKISHDNKYIAIGNNGGLVVIFEILNLEFFEKNIEFKVTENNYFNFLNETYLNVFKFHKKEIIEICWSY